MAEGLYDWYSPDSSKVLTFTPGNYGWASLIWKYFDQDAAILLPAAESFTTFSKLQDGNMLQYPRTSFDRAWKASIYPDHGLGGKNGELTDAIFEDSLKVGYEQGQELLSEALKQLSKHVKTKENNYIVFNDLTWERNGLVAVETAHENVTVKDEQDNIIGSQIRIDKNGKRSVVFEARQILSMGYRCYSIIPKKQQNNQILSLIKKADNDNNLIIRLTEMEGKNKDVMLTLPFSVKKIIRTNPIEEEQETLAVSGSQITLHLGHHAIETYKLILQ